MLRHLLRDTVVLVLDLDPRVSHVKVDPSQLDQVIINLVINSRDAMPTGGTLTVSTGNIAVNDGQLASTRTCCRVPYASLTVRDTGFGMDEATRTHVFEPFFTTKPLGKGTGLGLSTVYGIVKQSGGYIWVTSAPGDGTTVQVCFPPVEARCQSRVGKIRSGRLCDAFSQNLGEHTLRAADRQVADVEVAKAPGSLIARGSSARRSPRRSRPRRTRRQLVKRDRQKNWRRPASSRLALR